MRHEENIFRLKHQMMIPLRDLNENPPESVQKSYPHPLWIAWERVPQLLP